uniref:NADH dehydrogenase subunit 4L n=1 Tax=Illeis koebelei TaxID=420091 RepID=UPI002182165F|nr:NADH dehydrogenase subunit 4L [Illeis koebelei]UHJ19225.1 NADH dehydrogenase subunit 4L [Illeis koebelei]UVF63306.1 NADH dehydrogenase subunit 4L [Illeis koebelei]UXW88400.1 NADH dehydrogenase subunit 4L [Illeis cincta]
MMIHYIYMFISSMISFSLNRKHLLTMLLSMEFVILVLFFFIYYYLISFNYELYFVLFFLTMSVCESALGLSLLVSMIRSYGNDYFVSFNVLW